ncbi:MAG: polyphosphate kinase 2 family protein [Gemmatimonadota bacterium]|nr:MAG: polyphosphate kinase 2 family protein [Gemmatimonadota bacterium]
MFEAASDPYLVPFDGSFRIAKAPTKPKKVDKKQYSQQLTKLQDELDELQRMLYATDKYAVLVILQAMDAAGKDSTIRAVFRGVNPAGCQVFSFKQPSAEELDHDFLWRTNLRLPERGRIGVFNRSYYEEVLVVRVHPELLDKQKLPGTIDLDSIWEERNRSIARSEKYLARNGVVVLKFWLNVSKEEQRRRFLRRIDRPEKNWKFSIQDCEERRFWDDYMAAYEDTLNSTSQPWAPWYAIPADDKPFMRMKVAEILAKNLRELDIGYPEVDDEMRERLLEMRESLE